ncbi:Bacteroides conjugative transposon TraK protein [Filimonas lacunae]|uniref:Bacteroides conjugative transposon TraK protein n=1 Tax=Filimonas lacunae TaxID=477680 RepID=A0A173MAF3_9BACT|nr:conjugative transposon protein TraK [Filimonas lacunae]BAV04438.1 conjugative transposon protein TraK [Filimonas lacunae]SIT31445.1 Bacteroides conjugative transposon TraK protein [Filimonas lacunae]
MFQQLRNIDSAFRHVKTFSIVLTVANVIISCYAIYKSHQTIARNKDKVYVIAGDKFLQAVSASRAENMPIEIKDHIKTFHNYFFSLEPDESVIKRNITKSLYLADAKAKNEYDNLNEKGYYTGIVSGNISQQVMEPDSIALVTIPPYRFRYYGKLKMIRATSIVTRSLVTEGTIRVTSPSDNNPHGFLIENWRIIDNTDISIQNR